MILHSLKKPHRPFFNSGACVKPVEWSISCMDDFLVGRSHRSPEALQTIGLVMDQLRQLLNIPSTHKIALTPGSATGAMETAMWNLLGPPVSCVTWDIFSQHWAYNAAHQLKLDVSCHGWKDLKDLKKDRDLVLTWTGTTRGVWVGDSHAWLQDWQGLVLCDATSAAFIADLPWERLDAVAFSWQKALAGEPSSGILVLSPKAYHRLGHHMPPWPIPRLFRLKDPQGAIVDGIFNGNTLNTCSLWNLKEQEFLTRLWLEKGGMAFSRQRCQENFFIIQEWVEQYAWMDFLEPVAEARAQGPVCLKILDPAADSWCFLRKMASLLSAHDVAYDILNHAHDVPALRVWAGPSVESLDLERLGPWLNWAYEETKKEGN